VSQYRLAQVIPTHSSCSSSFMPSVASSLSSSFLPGVACGMHGRLPSYTSVFRPVQCGLQYVRWSSVQPGAACAVVFRSAQHGLRSVLPFRLGRHVWRSSDPPGAAYVEVFRPVWRGPVCATVFCSVWRGAVCAVVFCSARRGIGVPLCLVWPGVRGGPPFCPAQNARCSSILLGVACVALFRSARGRMRGGLPFHPVGHTRWCSVLSGVARYTRRCCRSVIGGPGSLVALPNDPVIIGVSDPRS